MESKFKLTGLSMPKRFTLETEKGQIFWADRSHLSDVQYCNLFDLAKNTHYVWAGNNYCIVQHDGYCLDGEIPKNPIITEIVLSL